MCEAEDRVEELEDELDRLKEKAAGLEPSDYVEGAETFRREAYRCPDAEIKAKLLFLAECFDALGSYHPDMGRFEYLANRIVYERV